MTIFDLSRASVLQKETTQEQIFNLQQVIKDLAQKLAKADKYNTFHRNNSEYNMHHEQRKTREPTVSKVEFDNIMQENAELKKQLYQLQIQLSKCSLQTDKDSFQRYEVSFVV